MAQHQAIHKSRPAQPSRVRIGVSQTTPDKPSHVPGTNKAEEWLLKKKDPGFKGEMRVARDATTINAKSREPIDPRMPHMPPP